MRSRRRLSLPPLKLLPSPTDELAAIGLRQVRAENGFFVHLALWGAWSLVISALGLLSQPPEPGMLGIVLAWGAIVTVSGLRIFVRRRRTYARRHLELVEEDHRKRREAAEESEVERLRRRLLKAAEEAREVLRQKSPETAAEISRGEAEALGHVAWLAEAEAVLNEHLVAPGRRREVAAELADPQSQDVRSALETLYAALGRHEGRLASLANESHERRKRVESFLLVLENVKMAPQASDVVSMVRASLAERVALLEEEPAPAGGGGRETARIREEVRLARDLQRSILPRQAPAVRGLEVAHLYRPSSEVGGDFYDFYATGSERLLVALGDASGHGLDASMVSSMAKSAVYMMLSARRGLADAMAEINRMMCDTLGRRRLMSLALVELDTASRRVAWSNAGQLYPLLLRDGALEELELPGYPLGVRRERSFDVREADFLPGDLLVLLTDGYVEAANDDDEPFGWTRLGELLLALPERRPERVVEALDEDLDRYLGAATPADDVTLIAISFTP